MNSTLLRLLGIVAMALICQVTAFAQAQYSIDPGATTTLPPGGALNVGCLPVNVQGTLNIGSGQVSSSGTLSIQGGTVNGGSGIITVGGGWNNSGTFNAGTGSVIFNAACTAGPVQVSGNTVFNNLTLTSSTGSAFVIPAGSNIRVNGVLTLQGITGSPIQLVSSGGQPAVITLGPSAQLVSSNAIVPCSVQIGAPSAQCSVPIPVMTDHGNLLLSLMVLLAAFWFGRNVLSRSLRSS